MSEVIEHIVAAPVVGMGDKLVLPIIQDIRVCLVGGQQIVRSAIREYLQSQGVHVSSSIEDETALRNLADAQAYNLLVLILSSGTYRTFHMVREILTENTLLPLVVLSEQVSRGQVYMALRIGAKAFVNLNADPTELVTAITMAAKNKVYLSPEAAELIVSDISTSGEGHNGRTAGKGLSKREIEIVQLLCEGLSSKEIGRHLHISTKTVENHRYNIYRKCEVESIAGLIRHAIQHGMIMI